MFFTSPAPKSIHRPLCFCGRPSDPEREVYCSRKCALEDSSRALDSSTSHYRGTLSISPHTHGACTTSNDREKTVSEIFANAQGARKIWDMVNSEIETRESLSDEDARLRYSDRSTSMTVLSGDRSPYESESDTASDYSSNKQEALAFLSNYMSSHNTDGQSLRSVKTAKSHGTLAHQTGNLRERFREMEGVASRAFPRREIPPQVLTASRVHNAPSSPHGPRPQALRKEQCLSVDEDTFKAMQTITQIHDFIDFRENHSV